MNRRHFVKATSVVTLGIGLTNFFPKNEKIRIGITSDSHYADRENSGTRFYRNSLDKMEEFVAKMNDEKVDFVIHLGDFKDEDPNQKASDTLKYLRKIESVYGQFEGERYHCLGNHDVDSITKQQFLANVENSGVSKDKSYYAFEQKGMKFIVLDANYHKDGRDQFYAEGANWQDPNIPKEEVEWLKAELAKDDKPTVVFCHHPLYDFQRGTSNYKVNNYLDIQEVMEKAGNVVAVFQGHVHEERKTEINGIHYITLNGMVDYEGLENNSFAIVEIEHSEMTINGYKRFADSHIQLD